MAPHTCSATGAYWRFSPPSTPGTPAHTGLGHFRGEVRDAQGHIGRGLDATGPLHYKWLPSAGVIALTRMNRAWVDNLALPWQLMPMLIKLLATPPQAEGPEIRSRFLIACS